MFPCLCAVWATDPGFVAPIRGCCDGSMRVDVEFPARHVMLLWCGWKTFARANSFLEGHILHFKLMESGLLSVRIIGRSGGRLGCCVESSTDDESASSSESDEEDNDGDDDSNGWRGDDSDSV